MVSDLRTLATTLAGYPSSLFFYMGSVAEGKAFFTTTWPEARAVSDPGKRFYTAFGLERGNLGQTFGPGVIACSLRAAAKGHKVGWAVGDPWQMPGIFLVQGPDVLWSHDFSHIADHPNFTILPRLVADLAVPTPT